MPDKTRFFSLAVLLLCVGAMPARAIMDGQGHDFFPVTAIFTSSASVLGGQGLLVTYGVKAGTITLTGGITASSGAFTQSGELLYSLQTSSGVNVLAGGVTAPFFAGGGAGLTAVIASSVAAGGVRPGSVAAGAIVDADINASAGIAPSKIAGTASVLGANTFTGAQTLPGDPASALQAAPKQYVDSWTRSCVNPADANDIMVPVGGLCVDKYEASVWSTATGGTQYGINGAADYPATCGNGLTATGQGCTTGAGDVPIYARSSVGYKPSTSITWFQANIACANVGKHLLTNSEWQAAAAGTPDPGAGVASPGCKVNETPDSASALTGERTDCVSGYGVENMVGSVMEWVADWGQYGQISQGTYTAWADGNSTTTHWPDAGYGADGSWNVEGKSYNGPGYAAGMPGAPVRGGEWGSGGYNGVFAFNANAGPSYWAVNIGLRCGRRR